MGKGEWFVLRTSGARTLVLANSLRSVGYDVWTPVKTLSKRRPRSTELREIVAAVLPSYVFAKVEHLSSLMIEADRIISPHPQFSVFRYCGKVPTISDLALTNLRKIERRNMPEKAARMFATGDKVRMTEGAYAGLTGIVKTGRGRYTMVLLAGARIPVKISSMLLVDEAQPESIAA